MPALPSSQTDGGGRVWQHPVLLGQRQRVGQQRMGAIGVRGGDAHGRRQRRSADSECREITVTGPAQHQPAGAIRRGIDQCARGRERGLQDRALCIMGRLKPRSFIVEAAQVTDAQLFAAAVV
ncbi:MAG: hypothetical protein UZ13_00859 [Chloroflexi bacterium OLB13]|nr:MAG: hypothetical protein UZ13_00859 [Chloroflexi bacterium OLB13]